MRLLIKAFILVVSLVVLAAAGAASYYRFVLPRSAPPSDGKVVACAGRIARGRYLFHAVSACGDCHSGRDFSLAGAPFLPGATGQGMVLPFGGLPGRVVAANLTPDAATGIGSWSDGEKIRALREGISRDGHPLFPLMPYSAYRLMSDEDAESLVAYLDGLPPIHNPLPATSINFPISLLIRSVPQPAGHVQAPAQSDMLHYGEYLATLGDCIECHTQDDRGKPLPGVKFAGGKEFDAPVGKVKSANISPDRATGIGAWSEDVFVERFKAYQKPGDKPLPKVTPQNFTVMPWRSYSQMDEVDLRAIFRYLQTQPAVQNKVKVHPL